MSFFDDTHTQILRRNPEALFADGLEDALVGYAVISNRALAMYSVQKVLKVFMERDGMSMEDAQEFFDFNVVGAYVGPNTPIFHHFDWQNDET